MTNGKLMEVESFAECSSWGILTGGNPRNYHEIVST